MQPRGRWTVTNNHLIAFAAKHALLVPLLLQAALLLSVMSTSLAGAAAPYLYGLWVCAEHLCFCAAFVLLPVAAAFHFGVRHLTANYGLMMIAQVCTLELGGVPLQPRRRLLLLLRTQSLSALPEIRHKHASLTQSLVPSLFRIVLYVPYVQNTD